MMLAATAAAALMMSAPQAAALPTGVEITPLAPRGAMVQDLDPGLPGRPEYRAGQAAAMSLSPDGKTLLLLTSGFNRLNDETGKAVPEASNEYVFVYDVSGGAARKTGVLPVKNTFQGLAWAPAGDRFYVSGGVDDRVYEYLAGPAGFSLGRTFALGHAAGLGILTKPMVAGLAVSPDGRRLIVCNYQNDSVTLIDLGAGRVVAELDLRPGVIDPKSGPGPGGDFPRAASFLSADRAFVAVQRGREIIDLSVADNRLAVVRRIRMKGQPSALIAAPARSRLLVALDNTDGLAIVDTRTDAVIERIATAGPAVPSPARRALGGVGSNAIALSPDGRTVLVSNGGQNAVAVVALGPAAAGLRESRREARRRDDDDAPRKDASAVVGLIPTGWYPTAVAANDRLLFIANGKSDPGPNPKACRDSLSIHGRGSCAAANQYVWQLEKGALAVIPAPSAADLARLTRQVAVNNHYLPAPAADRDAAVMSAIKSRIRHVVFVVKENRTYDQVLGDLEVGDGDPKLALLGRPLTPTQHALARTFVDLDNFMDTGESSNTGWNWTTAGRTTDFTEREAPVNYADRGLQYDQEGANRNVNVGYAAIADRISANPLTPKDPNLLSGGADVAAPDGPGGAEGEGYLWDAALRAGVTVRNYGFYGDLTRYEPAVGPDLLIPLEPDPFSKNLQVFFTTKRALRPVTDPYFRGFDQAFPDYFRFKEWEREFDGYAARGDLPGLTLLRLAHDHTGSFARGANGVKTIETEVADNDYALGLVIEKISRSRYAGDTLIFVVEDDAQDGADHVNAHRSIAFVAGPYVKHRAVISTRYTTVNLLKTIEMALGLDPLNLNDAFARPMSEVFDPKQASWSFRAIASRALQTTTLPIPPDAYATACPVGALRSAGYWERAMAGQDFSREDNLDTRAYNRALWRGLRPGEPEPRVRTGRNLSNARPKADCGPAVLASADPRP